MGRAREPLLDPNVSDGLATYRHGPFGGWAAAGQRDWAAGFTMPRTVRDFTKSPIAVISHSPENCLIILAIITPV
ncbi:hypothetical protein SAMN05442782_3602 [Streptomyces sp. OK228]|nr:hypothetical protein SAMN05442782_3602 [Streptomyces sp. OK228]